MANWRSGNFPGRLLVAAMTAFGIALVAGLPPESGRAQAQTGDAKSCERIVGGWYWFVNERPATPEVMVRPDGTLAHGDRIGRWFCDAGRGQFVIVWSHGVTDIMSLSPDGIRLSGTNNAGVSVGGVRKTAAASSPPPQQAAPVPTQAPPASAAEWTAGWSRMELTATLRPHSEDAKRGMLGIRIGSPDALISLLVPTLKRGTFVVNVTSDSAVSGLMQQGDIVTAIDGRSVRNATHLTSLVGRNPPGAQIKMEFWRWSGGYPELLAAIYRSAEANDPTATHILGALETLSTAGKPDYARAFAFYLRAAHLGSVHGMVAAANAYRFGSGADKNPSEAARWYRQAIELGSASAMFELGALIASGQIGDVDRAEVFRLMERAAKARHVMANYTIASYFSAGYGVERNPDASAWHLIEAIRNGGAEMLAQFSTEKSWQPSAEFYSALQRQLREAKVYRGPTDGKMNPQILAALTRLVESAP